MVSPPIPKALLDYLQTVFPNTLPEAPTTLENLGTLIGEQRVIKHLQAQFKAQTKAGLLSENP